MGVHRCRSTTLNWVQKSDLQPLGVRVQITLRLMNLRSSRMTADSVVRHGRCNNQPPAVRAALSGENTGAHRDILSELGEKHLVNDATFLVG